MHTSNIVHNTQYKHNTPQYCTSYTTHTLRTIYTKHTHFTQNTDTRPKIQKIYKIYPLYLRNTHISQSKCRAIPCQIGQSFEFAYLQYSEPCKLHFCCHCKKSPRVYGI